jgi:hypothetical protein
MAVVEAGYHGRAAEVDDFRVRPGDSARECVAADCHEPAVPDRDRGGRGCVAIERDDVTVHIDRVGHDDR